MYKDCDAELPPFRHDGLVCPVPTQHQRRGGARRRDPLRRRRARSGRPAARHDRAHHAVGLLQRGGRDVPGDRPPEVGSRNAAPRQRRARGARGLDGRAEAVRRSGVEPPRAEGHVRRHRERVRRRQLQLPHLGAVRDRIEDRLHGQGRPDRPPVEGRFERWGKWEEYDNWLTGTAPRALRIGCSAAVQSIDIGETITLPVDVHNRSAVAQSGSVELELPANFTGDAASKPYGTLAPGEQATVEFELTNTDATLCQRTRSRRSPSRRPTARRRARAGRTWRSRSFRRPRSRRRPLRRSSTAARGRASTAGPPSTSASAGRRRTATRRASTAAPASTRQVTRHGDDLYFFVHVRDDFQSYAVKPAECVAHWFADSVEITTDLRGTASQTNMDTASTFKLGVFVSRTPTTRRTSTATASTARAGLPTCPLGRASDLH